MTQIFFALLLRVDLPKKNFLCSHSAWIYQKKIFFALVSRGFTKKKFFALSFRADLLKKNFLRYFRQSKEPIKKKKPDESGFALLH